MNFRWEVSLGLLTVDNSSIRHADRNVILISEQEEEEETRDENISGRPLRERNRFLSSSSSSSSSSFFFFFLSFLKQTRFFLEFLIIEFPTFPTGYADSVLKERRGALRLGLPKRR